MKVLGLNGWIERGHDGGASLIVDGKLIYSIEEEKLIGKRHAYDTMPIESIKKCLEYGNLTLDDIDKFVIGWNYPLIYKMLNKEFMYKGVLAESYVATELIRKQNLYYWQSENRSEIPRSLTPRSADRPRR